MTKEEFLKSFVCREGETFESKAVFDDNRMSVYGATVCAFLNHLGGRLVIGVDEREIVGVTDAEDVAVKLDKYFSLAILPSSFVTVTVCDVDGCSIIVVDVPPGRNAPYACDHIFYVRNKRTDIAANPDQIRDMVMRTQNAPMNWEDGYSLADPGSDVSVDEIERIHRRVIRAKREEVVDWKDTGSVLASFDVLKFGRLTNCGDVMFCEHPERRYPQVRIRAYYYKGDKTSNEYLDQAMIACPLGTAIERAQEFIRRNTPQRISFQDGSPVRKGESFYPDSAIREALVNAVAHRNYESSGGGVVIHLYADHLVIWNSGRFPEGVNPARVCSGYKNAPIPVNPMICSALYQCGFMEQSGRGLLLIYQKCVETGMRPPKWNTKDGSGVSVTFYAPDWVGENAGRQADDAINDAIKDLPVDRKVHELICLFPGVKVMKLATMLRISRPTVDRIVRKLKFEGLIEYRGSKKTGGYYVCDGKSLRMA